MKREHGISRQSVCRLRAGVVGLMLALPLSGCPELCGWQGYHCGKPLFGPDPEPYSKLEPKPEPKPETQNLQVDDYGVEVSLLRISEHVVKSTATLVSGGVNRADLDPVSPPHWKAIEIVAKQKCPRGYEVLSRDWTPPAIVPLASISARYWCHGPPQQLP
jgi:hypothetical protein